MGIYWVQKWYCTGPTNHQYVYRMKNFVLASGRFLVVPYSNIIIPMCRVQQSSPGFSLSSMTFLRKSTFLLSHIWKFRINLKQTNNQMLDWWLVPYLSLNPSRDWYLPQAGDLHNYLSEGKMYVLKNLNTSQLE